MTPDEERPAEKRPAASEPTSRPPVADQTAPPIPPVGQPWSWPAVKPAGDRSPSISPSPRASHADRNAIAEQLRDAFADGRLDEEEFDVRIQAALSARTRDELAPLVADLVPAGAAAPVPASAPAHGPFARVEESGGSQYSFSIAVMGGVERKGRWRVPPESSAFALMGGVVLDLRAATLTSPVTTVRAAAIMGGVEVIVPPGVRVEMSGIPIMGGGDNRVDDDHLPATAPLIKIFYIALMGGVSVRTKAPRTGQIGDDRRELRQRRREHRRRELED